MAVEEVVRKVLVDEHADVLRESLRWLVAQLMEVEVSELIGAERGERTPDRATHRNGYRAREWPGRPFRHGSAGACCRRGVQAERDSWALSFSTIDASAASSRRTKPRYRLEARAAAPRAPAALVLPAVCITHVRGSRQGHSVRDRAVHWLPMSARVGGPESGS
jgi:hypothetical protein